ncbi:DNA replication licensing factor mcm10 [Daldinia childiae]|uniref:DNA replication licensing factor mcm10 n=1 Tax=Daldinia childiae TaxID=326645 RepID=UPI001447EE0F|nr:DNA replication licensing factor mcm10 [Daldinia childiae]KAF3054905.1 DNA replication licensing factor mcm10 [Daldinia childiae]
MAGPGIESETQWPPRSPHDVLLSTPKGREKLRRMAERSSPSPSPSKAHRRTPALSTRTGNSFRGGTQDAGMDMDENEDDDEDEDEEMLQLKLQAIQARLKLKKLQSAKAKKALGGSTTTRPESISIPDVPIASRARSRADSLRSGPTTRPQSQMEVQVPASPVRRAQTAQGDGSPSRVRLGIDKGIKAKDISLKRAPSFKRTTESQNGAQGGYLRRAHTPAPGGAEQQTKQERPMTFSERLAAARSEESTRIERQERVRQARSNAFELGRQEMEQLKSTAKDIPDIPLQPEQYSREQVIATSRIKRSDTVSSLRRPTLDENRPGTSSGGTVEPQAPPEEVPEEEASAFEPYSSVHLSKRVIPHTTLTRNLSGKKTYVIKDLLKHVKAPEFQLPEIEQDIVVFGILASKSDPRSHKTSNNNLKEKVESDPARGKYMVLQLVDLQWEVELFLFNSGFDRYWKLVPGTLLAILNPNIMPPPPGRTDTGRFSLVINSGEDTILEIGTARDLGFCKSIKKDGEHCNSWVNRKRTEFCEFHMNMGLAKHRQARQDVNAFNTGLGPRKDDGEGRRYKKSYRLNDWEHANDPKKKSRGNFDRSTQSQWFISKPSAASMLDNEILGGHIADRTERSEALKRRLVTQEKERDIMKQLGKVGSGAGKEYMKRGVGGSSTQRSASGSSLLFATSSTQAGGDEPRQDLDARSLGLVRAKGQEPKMHLSPIKRKRSEGVRPSSSSAALASSKPALGWGGNLKEKLTRMRDGEKLRPAINLNSSSDGIGNTDNDGSSVSVGAVSSASRSPARKKTRFVTEKGIREAGRESLGAELTPGAGVEDVFNTRAATPGIDRGRDISSRSSRARPRQMVVLDEDDDDELEILR